MHRSVYADFGDILLELDFRGPSVAVSDNFVLVGSPLRRTVFTYDVRTGEPLADLKLDDDPARIGRSMKIDGSIALVGANGYGAAYLFDVMNGQLLHKLEPEDPHPDQLFGSSMAIDNGIALVGAPRDNEMQDLGGAVYVFDVETGQQLRKLIPDVSFPRTGLIPLFGGSIAIEDGIAVIGESNSEVVDGYAIGGAYVFDIETGQQLRKLKNPVTPSTHDLFGSSIDIDSGRAIIGVSGSYEACPQSPSSCRSGSSLVFDLESGDVIRSLTLEDAQQSDHFGATSILEGNVAIVAGFNNAENGYFFDITSGEELMRIPSGHVFAAEDGRAVIVGRHDTQVIDIRTVPEPSSIIMILFAGLGICSRKSKGA
jgi:outer membrane protein assembly factor BamB